MEYSVLENQMERFEQILDDQHRYIEKLHETCDQLTDIDMTDYQMSNEKFKKKLTDEETKLVNTFLLCSDPARSRFFTFSE